MHSGLRAVPFLALGLLVVGGCGGDAGTSVVASDFSGTWSGTYALTGAQAAEGVPFRIDDLTGLDDTGMVFGSLASDHVAGAIAGTVDDHGRVVGVVENTVDGAMWTAIVERTGDGISIRLDREGTVATGQGTVAAPANGINYQVTITNQTDQVMPVELHTSHLYDHPEDYVWVEPGQSYTYETGAWCSIGIEGYRQGRVDEWKMSYYPVNCWGKETDGWRFWPCCRSSNWVIQPNPDHAGLCPTCSAILRKL